MVLSESLGYLWHHHHVSIVLIVPLHLGHISIIFPSPPPLQLHFPSTATSTTTYLLMSHHRHNHQICIVFPPLPPPPPSRPHFVVFTAKPTKHFHWSSSTNTTPLSYCFHHHIISQLFSLHHHISIIVFPPLPPLLPHLY